MRKGIAMLKVGIIGAGNISGIHASAYETLSERAQVVAVADIRKEKAEALAERLGADKVFDNADKLLQEDLDMVDICLPTFLHEEYVVKAARSGKHVLCEKPMALSVASADKMIEAAQAAGVKFMVAQCIRFWPEYVAVREKLNTGELGKIIAVTAARVGSAPRTSWNDWMLKPELSGGAVVDFHIHDVDFINSIIPSKPRTVAAVGVKSECGALNHVNTNITYEDGTIAAVEGDWFVPQGYPFTMFLRVTCEDGSIEFQFKAGVNIEKRNEAKPQVILYREGAEPEMLDVPEGKDAYLAEIEYFLDCIENDQEPAVVTPQDARDSLKVVLAARDSVEKNRCVELA